MSQVEELPPISIITLFRSEMEFIPLIKDNFNKRDKQKRAFIFGNGVTKKE